MHVHAVAAVIAHRQVIRLTGRGAKPHRSALPWIVTEIRVEHLFFQTKKKEYDKGFTWVLIKKYDDCHLKKEQYSITLGTYVLGLGELATVVGDHLQGSGEHFLAEHRLALLQVVVQVQLLGT